MVPLRCSKTLLDFIVLSSILFTLISFTSVFNLIISHSAYLNGKKYFTQAFSVIVCSILNIDKKRNTRELLYCLQNQVPLICMGTIKSEDFQGILKWNIMPNVSVAGQGPSIRITIQNIYPRESKWWKVNIELFWKSLPWILMSI